MAAEGAPALRFRRWEQRALLALADLGTPSTAAAICARASTNGSGTGGDMLVQITEALTDLVTAGICDLDGSDYGIVAV